MHILGEYKNNKILLESLYLRKTYRDYLCLSKNVYERENNNILLSIEDDFKRIISNNLPVFIFKAEIDLKQLLPEIVGYAELVSFSSIKEGHGSHLGLIWFQNQSRDTFQVIEEKLKLINWEEVAKDFEW